MADTHGRPLDGNRDRGVFMTVPRVELLNTGSELLLGSVRDAHLSWFGKELFPLGLRITRQTTVPDGPPIRSALLESFPRCEVLIVTGGLGPTTDDITRDLVAQVLGMKLLPHDDTLRRIQDLCCRRGFNFQPRMERQAMVPEGAIVLPNENGTAPGLHIRPVESVSWSSPHIFLLPGPPRELRPMARTHLLPFLEHFAAGGIRRSCRVYRVVGMGESRVESLIGLELSKRGDLEVGYCARPNEVDFRLIGSPDVLNEVEPLLLEVLGEHHVPGDETTLEEQVIALLCESGSTLATAESCTGGHLANRLTDVPGSSGAFLEGFITYSNKSKTDILGVPAELIGTHGAVSREVVLAMADGARERSGATYALATTGIAGPGGGSVEKPVGTVWMALSGRGMESVSWLENLPMDRRTFKEAVSQSALARLRKMF